MNEMIKTANDFENAGSGLTTVLIRGVVHRIKAEAGVFFELPVS